MSTGRLKIIYGAVSRDRGSVSFFVSPEASVWGTANPDWVRRNETLGARFVEVTVPSVEFGAVLDREGIPYYIKIDIEGSDLLCLDALRGRPGLPRFLSIEASKDSFADIFEQFAAFWQLGYRRFNLVPQHRVPAQRCPFPAREGEYVDYRFEPSSSGLFGEEAPGEWVDVEAALDGYRRILTKQRLLGDKSGFRQVSGLNSLMGVRQRGSRRLAREVYKRLRSMADAMGLRPGYYDTHAMLGSPAEEPARARRPESEQQAAA